ncbi:MAG: hypothetical protein M1833_006783 [Piccolia ochrophora]|nr:MAG: hypothetical protein M1833_006783 [Piccolia ochrophora]
MSATSDDTIILFHYSFSPFARRVSWYLDLRGIKYSQCIQPPTLPREDLTALGISYRRIPILSIGRDVYYDTRLILRKLEEKVPAGSLGATADDLRALERLLERWTVDAGIFARASQLIPPTLPLLRDPKFQRDREDYTGRSWSRESVEVLRPEALVEVRDAFSFLESTLLADGREWILSTQTPTLADIEAIWPFHWLTTLDGALPPTLISKRQFPKAYEWITRFSKAIAAARTSNGRPASLKGSEAVTQITSANFFEPDPLFDETDPSGFKVGEVVELFPIDTGSRHHDVGRLVGLSPNEVVLEIQKPAAETSIRVHAPRHGFRVQRPPNTSKAHL